MAVTVGDLVNEVRDFHMSFSEQVMPRATVVRFLERHINVVMGEINDLNPDVVSVPGQISEDAILEALTTTPNARANIEIPSFAHLLDSATICRKRDGVEFPVVWVSLGSQYQRETYDSTAYSRSPQYEHHSAAVLDSAIRLTDLRLVSGNADPDGHGWMGFGPLHYDFVPYITLTDKKDSDEVENLNRRVRSTAVLSTAIMFAKREGLIDYAAALEGEYRTSFHQYLNQVASVTGSGGLQ